MTFVFQKVIISRIYMQFWLCLISFPPRGGTAAEMRLRAGQWAGVLNPDPK
jgi:hypothetical protein